MLSTDEQVQVPFGHFDNVLMTKDFTPLAPRVLEYKLYARGVGPVLVLGVSGGGGWRSWSSCETSRKPSPRGHGSVR